MAKAKPAPEKAPEAPAADGPAPEQAPTQEEEAHLNPAFVIELQGQKYANYKGVLDLAHQKGLRSIKTKLIQIPGPDNNHVAIVQAKVVLVDSEGIRRVFCKFGDASPSNVSNRMATAIIRFAETRAVGRALRDAVNIGDTLLEELGEEMEKVISAVAPAGARGQAAKGAKAARNVQAQGNGPASAPKAAPAASQPVTPALPAPAVPGPPGCPNADKQGRVPRSFFPGCTCAGKEFHWVQNPNCTAHGYTGGPAPANPPAASTPTAPAPTAPAPAPPAVVNDGPPDLGPDLDNEDPFLDPAADPLPAPAPAAPAPAPVADPLPAPAPAAPAAEGAEPPCSNPDCPKGRPPVSKVSMMASEKYGQPPLCPWCLAQARAGKLKLAKPAA